MPVAPALDVLGRGLAAASEGRRTTDTVIRSEDGQVVRVPFELWLGPLTAADETVVARVRGPVLDIGCGPGRHVHELARRGVLAVGLDVSPVAVRLARTRGVTAVEGSVFGPVVGAGRWQTALLLDGSLGIGGEPGRLLARVAELLAPDGRALVELEPPGGELTRARLEDGHGTSEWFAWARVDLAQIDPLAAAAGLAVRARWEAEGRVFAELGAAR